MPARVHGPAPAVTLPCPKGRRLGGMQLPERELPLAQLGYTEDSIVGLSMRGRIQIAHCGLARPLEFTVGIDCRRPDELGSISPDTNRRRAAPRCAAASGGSDASVPRASTRRSCATGRVGSPERRRHPRRARGDPAPQRHR